MRAKELDLRGTIELFRRQLKIVLLTAALVFGLAGLALLVLKPVYRATALVEINPLGRDLLHSRSGTVPAATETAHIESAVALIEAEPTLVRAMQIAGLTGHPEFALSRLQGHGWLAGIQMPWQAQGGIAERAPRPELEQLRKAVQVGRRGNSLLIEVSAQAGSPELAADIANGLARAYIQEQLAGKIAAALDARSMIAGRLDLARAEVSALEQSFDAFVAEILQGRVNRGERDLLTGQWQALRRLEAALERDEARAANAEAAIGSRDWTAAASALLSSALSRLAAQNRSVSDGMLLSPDSGDSARLAEEFARSEAALAARAREELDAFEARLAEERLRAGELRQSLRSAVLKSDLRPEEVTRVYELQQSAEIARSQHETLLARMRGLEAEVYLQVPDAQLVARALPPGSAFFPNRTLVLTLASIAATGLGLGLAFLNDRYVAGFSSGEEMQEALGLAVVTVVPHDRIGARAGDTPRRGVRPTLLADSIDRARHAIDQALAGERAGRASLVLVTSAEPTEGKTTLALALARAYAQSGRSTLLVDCDFRRPSLHRRIGIEPVQGLGDYLGGGPDAPDFDEIVHEDAATGLHIVPGSHMLPIATDQLISNGRLMQMLERARQGFELVIIDTPPVLAVADALHLAPHADAVVFVTRWARTPALEAQRALALIRAAGAPSGSIVGVLNQENGRQSTRGRKYAAYYAQA